MVVCQSCGGTYDPVLADGMQYFHRCPPLSVVELAAAVKAGKVKLPDGEEPDVAVTRRVYERAQLRDENRPSTFQEHAGQIVSAGRGVKSIRAPEPIQTEVDMTDVVLAVDEAVAIDKV
jgi:hypothetical protein